jgi:NitT/TauT family transport system substrate-binding protein
MNKTFWKQFAIALALFLLGYFTFNSKLFAQTIEFPTNASISAGDKSLL